jgi:hypothetical protein
MSTLPKINVELTLGDTILVGKNKQPAEITKIEYHSHSGEVTLNTTKGPRKMLTFSLVEPDESADHLSRYR